MEIFNLLLFDKDSHSWYEFCLPWLKCSKILKSEKDVGSDIRYLRKMRLYNFLCVVFGFLYYSSKI